MLFPVPRTTALSELVIDLVIKFRRAKSLDTLQIMHRKEVVGPAKALATSDWKAGDPYTYEMTKDECRKSYQELAASFHKKFDIPCWAASIAAAHRVLEIEVGRKLDFRIDRLVHGRNEDADWIQAASQIQIHVE